MEAREREREEGKKEREETLERTREQGDGLKMQIGGDRQHL